MRDLCDQMESQQDAMVALFADTLAEHSAVAKELVQNNLSSLPEVQEHACHYPGLPVVTETVHNNGEAVAVAAPRVRVGGGGGGYAEDPEHSDNGDDRGDTPDPIQRLERRL